MHIFSYKWHDNGLSAEQITELKEMIADRTLVMFQNFPVSASDSFPGGTFNPNEDDETRGLYVYSAEAGVMDRSDWMATDVGMNPPAQAIHIFGDIIVNVDVEAGTDEAMKTLLQDWIESEEKVVCVAGFMEDALTLNGYGTVNFEEGDTSYAMAKTGKTIVGMDKWQYGVGDVDLKPIAFSLV